MTVPTDWRTAVVTPIFKKGTRTDPGNYRPVSLTCVTCKILESFVRDVIVNHMTDNDLYAKCQHGFRKKRSCVTQLLEVMEDFTTMFNNGDIGGHSYESAGNVQTTASRKPLQTPLITFD